MPSVKYEVIAKTGTYTTRTGEEKNKWAKLGVVLQGDKGFSLIFDAIPVGWDGRALLVEPKPKEERKPVDDDVPF